MRSWLQILLAALLWVVVLMIFATRSSLPSASRISNTLPQQLISSSISDDSNPVITTDRANSGGSSPKPQPKSETCIEPTLESAFQDVNESIESLGVRRRFPQAIIIGVSKAGTSAMKVMLSLHPQIVAPGKDEIKFFTKYWNASLQWYLDQTVYTIAS